jgi:glyoxylase-like metal-dependent hydrolase (beta-lactamase superfamily II)
VSAQWALDVLIPTHRVVLGILDGEIVETRAASPTATFEAYRKLEGAIPGMIAWPNTVLASGPQIIVVDPGYQTQGDMLAGALQARGIETDSIATVLMTHLHSDHLSAVRQLGHVRLFVHEDELDTPHAKAQSGLLEPLDVQLLRGDEGDVLDGVRWVHTPGHSPGHVVFFFETADGNECVAGDTLGPDPEFFASDQLPPDFPDRELHVAAFRKIRAEKPRRIIPGHYGVFETP